MSAAWAVFPKNSNLLVARAKEFGVTELMSPGCISMATSTSFSSSDLESSIFVPPTSSAAVPKTITLPPISSINFDKTIPAPVAVAPRIL